MKYLKLPSNIVSWTLALAGFVSAAGSALAQSVPAQPIDRVVAVVNEEPILASDIDESLRLELLLDAKPAAGIASADERSTLERHIDRMLLRQQMAGTLAAVEHQVTSRLEQLRAVFPQAKSEEQWKALLAQYGVDESRVRKSLEEQSQILQFIDTRLRPMVRVSRPEVESYYNEKLVPELKAKGAAIEPLARVQSQIWEIVRQQKMDQQLTTWLASLRQQGSVRILAMNEAGEASRQGAAGRSATPRGSTFTVMERR